MKYFSWNEEKNKVLQAERDVSFDDIILYIEMGFLLDILEHPNRERYPGQKILVVQGEAYIYLVLFVESENEVFPKTIIPSRKATRKYWKGDEP